MDAYAYSLQSSSEQLTSLLARLAPGRGQAILESVTSVCFVSIDCPPDDFQFDENFNPQTWERGRVFGPDLEIRWRRHLGHYAVLLIADISLDVSEAAVPGITFPKPTLLSKIEGDGGAIGVVLWGEWQGRDPDLEDELPSQDRHYWYEARIPQFLAYPWPNDTRRLALEIAQYQVPSPDSFPGDRIYRFVRLAPERSQ